MPSNSIINKMIHNYELTLNKVIQKDGILYKKIMVNIDSKFK